MWTGHIDLSVAHKDFRSDIKFQRLYEDTAIVMRMFFRVCEARSSDRNVPRSASFVTMQVPHKDSRYSCHSCDEAAHAVMLIYMSQLVLEMLELLRDKGTWQPKIRASGNLR